MTENNAPTPHTFLILGGNSDLAGRLLIPGIADYLSLTPQASIRIVGSSRSDDNDYPGFIRDALHAADVDGVTDEVIDHLADTATWITADVTDRDELAAAVDHAVNHQPDARLVIYYGLAPDVTEDTVDHLRHLTLPEGTVLAMEKPFGVDAASAAELEDTLTAITDEDHLFRVDHFLSQSATINLIGALEANHLLQASWNHTAVEAIDIVYDEALGLEGRAEFYDSTGAAEDMLQSHLLNVAARILAATDPATSVNDVLDAATADLSTARRARYTAGTVDGREMPAYADEEGVDPDQQTETLAQVSFTVDNEQWRGVPVTLRSGKAIGHALQAITVTYKPTEQHPDAPTTRLVVPFEDKIALDVNVADHGDPDALQQVRLSSGLSPSRLTPYARVVKAIVTDDHAVEVPAGAPQRAWAVMQPVLDAFSSGEVPLDEYEAGSHGPQEWFDEK